MSFGFFDKFVYFPVQDSITRITFVLAANEAFVINEVNGRKGHDLPLMGNAASFAVEKGPPG